MKRLRFAPVLLAVLVLASILPSQEPEPAATQEPVDPARSVVAPAPGEGFYVGSASCGTPLCHGSVRPRDVYEIRQNEYQVWRTEDPHFRTYEVLSNPRSFVIGRNLGLDGPPRESTQCLSCHAFTPSPERVSGQLPVEDGISCEGCHGPAGGWIGSHDEEDWTHADSVEHGMVDLRDPSVRAARCLDCHLGAEGRDVGHRLLAAGHPLLEFELDNFDAEISHWRNRPDVDGARAWAVGQVVALHTEMEQIVRKADSGAWPELAFMSCVDCHHPLAEERWRLEGTQAPVTGYPRWSPVRWATLRHVVDTFAAAESEALADALDRVGRTVGRLGTPATDAVRAARRTEEITERVIPAVEQARWSEEQILEILARIGTDERWLIRADYASARQVAYAVNALASNLVAEDSTLLRTRLPDAAEALYQAVRDPYHFDRERFADALGRLASTVRRLR